MDSPGHQLYVLLIRQDRNTEDGAESMALRTRVG